MGRGFGLDMYIAKVANKEVVKLEEVAKVALQLGHNPVCHLPTNRPCLSFPVDILDLTL